MCSERSHRGSFCRRFNLFINSNDIVNILVDGCFKDYDSAESFEKNPYVSLPQYLYFRLPDQYSCMESVVSNLVKCGLQFWVGRVIDWQRWERTKKWGHIVWEPPAVAIHPRRVHLSPHAVNQPMLKPITSGNVWECGPSVPGDLRSPRNWV